MEKQDLKEGGQEDRKDRSNKKKRYNLIFSICDNIAIEFYIENTYEMVSLFRGDRREIKFFFLCRWEIICCSEKY